VIKVKRNRGQTNPVVSTCKTVALMICKNESFKSSFLERLFLENGHPVLVAPAGHGRNCTVVGFMGVKGAHVSASVHAW